MKGTESNHRAYIGSLGEQVCVRFLRERGFAVDDVNVTNKAGELDIIAHKKDRLYFFEVKTVTQSLADDKAKKPSFLPIENLHHKKIEKLNKTIHCYLQENNVACDWQLDGLLVYVDINTNQAKVEHLECLSLE